MFSCIVSSRPNVVSCVVSSHEDELTWSAVWLARKLMRSAAWLARELRWLAAVSSRAEVVRCVDSSSSWARRSPSPSTLPLEIAKHPISK